MRAHRPRQPISATDCPPDLAGLPGLLVLAFLLLPILLAATSSILLEIEVAAIAPARHMEMSPPREQTKKV